VTAFINGGLTGVGLGQGELKFANNLPFPHTDSIFAVIGEELGLLGSFGVIALYVFLVYRGFTIARYAPDAFGGLLAAGVTCWLAYDALLNIAVMTALIRRQACPCRLSASVDQFVVRWPGSG
jgi:cell division protein FtsW